MTLPYDEKLATSRMSQIQPTGNNPSLLLFHTTLPLDFSEGYYVSVQFVFFVFVFDKDANLWYEMVVCIRCLTWVITMRIRGPRVD